MPNSTHQKVPGTGRRGLLQLAGTAGVLAGAAATVAHAQTATDSHITAQPTPSPGAEQTTSDVLVGNLIAWSATHVFGMVGDGINPVIEALRKRRDRIAFIGVRHEEAAAFMAGGMAKHTGRLGVCLTTTGTGAVHMLNGLYDAAMDGAPVVAITGDLARLGGYAVHAGSEHRQAHAGCGGICCLE